MKNIIDYAKTYHKTFEEKQFNEVDALVLAQLCYINLKALWKKRKGKPLPITELAQINDDQVYNVRRGNDNKKLVQAMAEGIRFRDITIIDHETITDKTINEQFSATVYSFNGTAFVAYRGTDRSVIGWSENFNMTYMTTVPSEETAVKFLNKIGNKLPSKFFIGGHSKGGHLSIFASSFCKKEYQDKIIRIFNFDGPGLEQTQLNYKEYKQIEDKIITILPETSIFGIMRIFDSKYYVVKSNGLLLSQHEPFLWDIKYNSFVYEQALSPISTRLKKSMASFINDTDPKKRELFFKVLNDYLAETGAHRPLDITLNFYKTVPLFFSTYDKLSKEELQEVRQMFWQLIKMMATIQSKGHTESTFKLVEGLNINKKPDKNIKISKVEKEEKNTLTNLLKNLEQNVFDIVKKEESIASDKEAEVIKSNVKVDEKTVKKEKVKKPIQTKIKSGNNRSNFDLRSLIDLTGRQLDILLNKIIAPINNLKNNVSKTEKNQDDLLEPIEASRIDGEAKNQKSLIKKNSIIIDVDPTKKQ